MGGNCDVTFTTSLGKLRRAVHLNFLYVVHTIWENITSI